VPNSAISFFYVINKLFFRSAGHSFAVSGPVFNLFLLEVLADTALLSVLTNGFFSPIPFFSLLIRRVYSLLVPLGGFDSLQLQSRLRFFFSTLGFSFPNNYVLLSRPPFFFFSSK